MDREAVSGTGVVKGPGGVGRLAPRHLRQHAQYTLNLRLVRHAGAADARPVSREKDMNTRN